jgi:hypothetical protein
MGWGMLRIGSSCSLSELGPEWRVGGARLTSHLAGCSAFSPPRPYPKTHAREKVAGLAVVPLALAIALVPLDVFAQAASFAFGVGFFCQPMLFGLGRRIAHRVPDWQDKIDPRK